VTIGAGERSNFVTFERAVVTKDALGGAVKTWSTHCEEWAAISYGTGAERREASQEVAAQPGTFTVLGNEKTIALSVTDRINFDGLWDIASNVPSRALPGGRDITAVRRAN